MLIDELYLLVGINSILDILETIMSKPFRIISNPQPSPLDTMNNQQRMKQFALQKKQYLADVLTNRNLYLQKPVTENIFETDLVIKIQVPNEMYIKRMDQIQIGDLLRNPSKNMIDAYSTAFQRLYKQMQFLGEDLQMHESNNHDTQKELLLRNVACFSNKEKEEEQNELFFKGRKKMETINENYSGVLDSFTIVLNTILYTLQTECGFETKTFLESSKPHERPQKQPNYQEINFDKLTDRQFGQKLKQLNKDCQNTIRNIYICLHLPISKVMKVSNNYHIKKQIDYLQLDSFINEPMNQQDYPFRYNPYLTQKSHDKSGKLSQRHIFWSQKLAERKTIQRKLKFRYPPYAPIQIHHYNQISHTQQQKYQRFTNALLAEKWDLRFIEISQNQREYLGFVSRGKQNNLGVEKVYREVKIQREYSRKIGQISKKQGFKHFVCPDLFAGFFLKPKSAPFFERIRHILLYRQYEIGPYRDKALFNKMQRIKVAYLKIKQIFLLANFDDLQADLFALNDNFQKYGEIGNPQQLTEKYFVYEIDANKQKIFEKQRGGLYGSTLQSKWPTILFFKADFKAIRAYLGELPAYKIFLKVNFLTFFSFLSGFGVAGQLIKQLVVKPATTAEKGYNYIPEIIFYMVYLLTATCLFAAFTQNFRRKQKIFLRDYEQSLSIKEFRPEYQGPYIRNIFTDSLNDYSSHELSMRNKIKCLFFFLLVILMIGVEVGFYYLIRFMIISISSRINDVSERLFYVIEPIHFIGYGIFLFTNQILSRTLIRNFFYWLTRQENWSHEQSFNQSQKMKMYLLLVSIQLIAPIDLVYVQYAQKTYCSAFWCMKEVQSYAYSRYFVYFLLLLIKSLLILGQAAKNRLKVCMIDLNEIEEKSVNQRLINFLGYIVRQSEKKKMNQSNFEFETIYLLNFCTFLIFFPFGSFLSFLLILLDYLIERQDILRNTRRPIPKCEKIDRYSTKASAIYHWLILFSISQMIIVLEWMQYVFQDILLALVTQPNFYKVMLGKYVIIFILFIAYEIVGHIVRKIVKKFRDPMQTRKQVIYKKFIEKGVNRKKFINTNIKYPKLLTTVARVINYTVDSQDSIAEIKQNENNNNKKVRQKYLSDSAKQIFEYN